MVRSLALVILPNHPPKCQTSGDILRKWGPSLQQTCVKWIILVWHHNMLVVRLPKFWDIVSHRFIHPARMMDPPKRKQWMLFQAAFFSEIRMLFVLGCSRDNLERSIITDPHISASSIDLIRLRSTELFHVFSGFLEGPGKSRRWGFCFSSGDLEKECLCSSGYSKTVIACSYCIYRYTHIYIHIIYTVYTWRADRHHCIMIHLCMCHFINRIDVLILHVGELFHTMMLLSVLSLATSFYPHTLQAKDRPCKLRDCHWIRSSMIRLEVLGGGMTWVGDLNGLLRMWLNSSIVLTRWLDLEGSYALQSLDSQHMSLVGRF